MERNIAVPEQIGSLLAGGTMFAMGVRRGGLSGIMSIVAGSALLAHGVSGRSRVYQALGVDTAHGPGWREIIERASHVHDSIAVNRPPGEVFRFWRDVGNLPRFMLDIESVEDLGHNRSRWHARGPLGVDVRWDAEIVEEQADRLIRWRTIDSESNVEHEGAVRFEPAPGNRGTIVRTDFHWKPPGGVVGAAAARLLPQDPARRVREDLRRFRQLLEAGEIARTGPESEGSRRRLQRQRDEVRDEVEEAGVESFPASDPPSFAAP